MDTSELTKKRARAAGKWNRLHGSGVPLIYIGSASCGRAAGAMDVLAAVKKTLPTSELKKGQIVRGVIVRTRHDIHRPDGSAVRFDRNAMVILADDQNPKGTRIFGAVARELRERNFMKIVSLASEVV